MRRKNEEVSLLSIEIKRDRLSTVLRESHLMDHDS